MHRAVFPAIRVICHTISVIWLLSNPSMAFAPSQPPSDKKVSHVICSLSAHTLVPEV